MRDHAHPLGEARHAEGGGDLVGLSQLLLVGGLCSPHLLIILLNPYLQNGVRVRKRTGAGKKKKRGQRKITCLHRKSAEDRTQQVSTKENRAEEKR